MSNKNYPNHKGPVKLAPVLLGRGQLERPQPLSKPGLGRRASRESGWRQGSQSTGTLLGGGGVPPASPGCFLTTTAPQGGPGQHPHRVQGACRLWHSDRGLPAKTASHQDWAAPSPEMGTWWNSGRSINAEWASAPPSTGRSEKANETGGGFLLSYAVCCNKSSGPSTSWVTSLSLSFFICQAG